MNRLDAADRSQLNGTNDGMAAGAVATTWALDNLGHWSNSDEPHGSKWSVCTDYGATGETIHHNVDAANQIVDVTNGTGFHFDAPVDYRYDPSGNLIDDGTYLYFCDAFNRLVQINRRTQDEVCCDALNRIICDVGPSDCDNWQESSAGETLVTFPYDALGSCRPGVSGGELFRLIRCAGRLGSRYNSGWWGSWGVFSRKERHAAETIRTVGAEISHDPPRPTRTHIHPAAVLRLQPERAAACG